MTGIVNSTGSRSGVIGTTVGAPTATGTITSGTWEGTDVAVAHGGTGASTHTANNVLIGAGASAITSVAPGADGQVLTSTGTVWQSEAAGGGGAWSEITSGSMSEGIEVAFGDDHNYDVIKLFITNMSITDGYNLDMQAKIAGSTVTSGYLFANVAVKANSATIYNINSTSSDSMLYVGELGNDETAKRGHLEVTVSGGNNASMIAVLEYRAWYWDYYNNPRRHNGVMTSGTTGKVQSLIWNGDSSGSITGGEYVALGLTI